MTQDKIDRINALAKKSRTPGGLTPEEQAEQAALRREYIDACKASLRTQLDSTLVQEADGSRHPLKRQK